MNPPHFWSHGLDPYSREAAPFVRAMLTPLANIYAWAGARRMKNAEPYNCGVPVICAGNVTVGGTGKSPLVAKLREMFAEKGVRAASLSRGYKGELKGPLKVNPDIHTAKQVGDEPLMLALKGESWIGADRAAAGKAMAEDGVQLIIMDDGFQNPQLQKDHSILVIDAAAPFGNGHVIPKGPLREPISAAEARANSIVLVGAGPRPEVLRSGRPVLRARIEPLAPPPGGPLIAFAGIGRPQKFFDALIASGGEICESIPYPDHHTYSDGDLSYLRKLGEERSASLITTEKDLARLPAHQRSGIHSWPVEIVFDDVAALNDCLAPIQEMLAR